MPVTKSAQKAMRVSMRKRKRNYAVRAKVKEIIKETLAAIKAQKVEESRSLLKKAYKIIDLAAKKRVYAKRNAARKKARLARALNTLQAKGETKTPSSEISAKSKDKKS